MSNFFSVLTAYIMNLATKLSSVLLTIEKVKYYLLKPLIYADVKEAWTP